MLKILLGHRSPSLAKSTLGVALAMGVLTAGQAQADQFNFSYSDGTNTANGVLDADLIGIDTYLGLAELSFTGLRTYRGRCAGSPALGHSIKD